MKHFSSPLVANKILIQILITILSIIVVYFAGVEVYALNKGFSIWDEGYYLLSYKMAASGFYAHFNNTPFVVAFFLEPFHPGLIGYRIIHLLLNILGVGFFSYVIAKYFKTFGFALSSSKLLLFYLLGFYGAIYTYSISITTLSYNHINEFFVLVSEAFLLLGIIKLYEFKKTSILFVIIAGMIAAIDVYIKPPSFILLILINILSLFVLSPNSRTAIKYIGWFFLGFIASTGFSLVFIVSLAHWAEYLSFMRKNQTHSPYKTLIGFVSSGWDMLRTIGGITLSSLAVMLWAEWCTKLKSNKYCGNFICGFVTTSLLGINIYLIYKFLAQTGMFQNIGLHWWVWWVFSANILLFIVVTDFLVGFLIFFQRDKVDHKFLGIVLFILVLNPVILSVGTVNGFGQVQMHVTSWLLLNGLIFFIFLQGSSKIVRIYAALFLLALASISFFYFNRQLMPVNISGEGAIYDQKYAVPKLSLLHNVFVDRPTHHLLMQMELILDRYPKSATLVFFDIPGMQYIFDRKWVVSDPWLTNYEHPYTKDDVYNCHMITGQPERLRQAIFIVANDKDISADLRGCLSKIGYPNNMNLLGVVNGKLGSVLGPIKVYLHK